MSTTILATITAKPEFTGEVEAALRKMVPATRAEAGNISYELFRLKENASTFHLLEIYASDEALATHGQSAHFSELVISLAGKLTRDIQIEQVVALDAR